MAIPGYYSLLQRGSSGPDVALVQTWLNGEEMVDITDAKIGAAQGRIALQIHDGGGIKVQWRNFRLTTL